MKYKKIRGPVLTQCAINRSFKKEKEEKELGFFLGGGAGENIKEIMPDNFIETKDIILLIKRMLREINV